MRGRMTNQEMFEKWVKGCGVIQHSPNTQKKVKEFEQTLRAENIYGDGVPFYEALIAADHIANAAMWIAVHQVYAKHVYLDGRELKKSDFKEDPQGHLGSSLNMIPAYTGYMLANVLTGITRSWVMEQGHAVAAIDTINVMLDNMTKAHAERYSYSNAGLTRFAQDFYSYKLNVNGNQDSPLGSHVNPHSGGGHLEGGYLGFASVQYVHMPLPGESLVAFLSDGAFEEQRGADWAARWWRAEDCGNIIPIMIANGRRIDQRTSIMQDGGATWFARHLKLNNMDPIIFDGRDPAAFAWAIWKQERALSERAAEIQSLADYDIMIPYGVAIAPKGAGFYNEGTNYAHNLPLVDNPSRDVMAVKRFNTHARKFFVDSDIVKEGIKLFQRHEVSSRIKERDHTLSDRRAHLKKKPELSKVFKEKYGKEALFSPMDAVDNVFLKITEENPHLRPRFGNPDEILSNRMKKTLEALEFRVKKPEEGIEESSLGKIITALNEEAIAGAAFGNKGGVNIIVTYEAFGAKMFGIARQEVIFSKHKKDLGKPSGWLSVPIVLTSNTWENSKNELSHQDPSLAESMLSETADVSRVVFPADFNSATETINQLYQTNGQIWTVIIPKQKTPIYFSPKEAQKLVQNGAINIEQAGHEAKEAPISIIAVGAFQLTQALRASARLRERKVPHRVSYLFEPGKFRFPRNLGESRVIAPIEIFSEIVSDRTESILIVSHTRPEVMLGTLQPLWEGRLVKSLGFINRGGTLGIDEMSFVNNCSWAHILFEAAKLLKICAKDLLSNKELDSIKGLHSPDGIITKLNSQKET